MFDKNFKKFSEFMVSGDTNTFLTFFFPGQGTYFTLFLAWIGDFLSKISRCVSRFLTGWAFLEGRPRFRFFEPVDFDVGGLGDFFRDSSFWPLLEYVSWLRRIVAALTEEKLENLTVKMKRS